MSLATCHDGPPKGWNSFDCFGVFANEKVLLENLEVFANKLRPSGYEYFVVDAGWYYNADIPKGRKFPFAEDIPNMTVAIDGYGRPLPATCFFPNGLVPLIERCHQLNVKFGIHVMRGVPRAAADSNLPVFGSSSVTCGDIADRDKLCPWCDLNYGIDMTVHGAQAYYDALVALLAAWGVDFIKADDIVPYPDETAALIEAVEKAPREITLSLSPGERPLLAAMDLYRKAHMLRVSHDIWDLQSHIDDSFERWEMFQGAGDRNFRVDLDMIPFGRLSVWKGLPGADGRDEDGIVPAGDDGMRMSRLNLAQKQTFMTMRALAASPLFMGGELTHTDERSFQLLTNHRMLACNQFSQNDRMLNRKDGIDVWTSQHRHDDRQGWVGAFNRSDKPKNIKLDLHRLGLCNGHYRLLDVWEGTESDQERLNKEHGIPGHGVLFLNYLRLDTDGMP